MFIQNFSVSQFSSEPVEMSYPHDALVHQQLAAQVVGGCMTEDAKVTVHTPDYHPRLCIVELRYLLLHPFHGLARHVDAVGLDICAKELYTMMDF